MTQSIEKTKPLHVYVSKHDKGVSYHIVDTLTYPQMTSIAQTQIKEYAYFLAAAPELLAALKDLLPENSVSENEGRFECKFCGRNYGCADSEAPENCASDDCPDNIARALIKRIEA
jgi:hypothetical protein